jgi:hypothetical protein
MGINSGLKGLSSSTKIVEQVGINKGIILRRTAYQISTVWLFVYKKLLGGSNAILLHKNKGYYVTLPTENAT